MTFDTYIRSIVGIVGIVLAVLLVRDLLRGRTRLLDRIVRRERDGRTYWGALCLSALYVLICVAFTLLPPPMGSMALFGGFFGGQLLLFLVSGEVPRTRGRVWSRANGDRGYWRWVILTSVMLAIYVIFFLLTLILRDRA